MISISVNGKHEEIAEGATMIDLLAHLGLADKRVAVERNREIVPRSEHGTTRVEDGDDIEIVQAIGGG